MAKKQQPSSQTVKLILRRLRKEHPTADYALQWETPFQLLMAAILAAQCTDERVNQVTKELFPKYPDAKAFAGAKLTELEQDIKTISFYRKKAKRLQDVCGVLINDFQGDVPHAIDELVELPGVARKTANVVLNVALGIPSGIIVDSHVERVAKRLGLTTQKNNARIEQDLMSMTPQDDWTYFGPAIVLYGRHVCTAKKPKCDECVLSDLCPKVGVEDS